MPILLLAHNGIGLGHLSRAAVLADTLKRAGESPALVTQGDHGPELTGIAFSRVRPLWQHDPAEQRKILAHLIAYARMFSPSVLIEDTIPCAIDLPSTAPCRRILVVRPVEYGALQGLRQTCGDTYDSFLIADAPESPTWPYTESETTEIGSWNNWYNIGPIFRTAQPSEVAAVSAKYNRYGTRKLCVATMGGGGEHEGTCDAERFLEAAAGIAQQLREHDPGWAFLLVKGPYFDASHDPAIPELFDVVEHEAEMPALLARADLAVIRPGFNTTWECIMGRTPFIPIVGSTFQEPVNQRLARLEQIGLVPPSLAVASREGNWTEAFRSVTTQLADRWTGRPQQEALVELLCETRKPRPVAVSAAAGPAKRILLVCVNGIGIGHVERTIEMGLMLTRSGVAVHMLIHTKRWHISSDAVPLPHTVLPPFGSPSGVHDEHLSRYAALVDSFDPHAVVYDCHRRIPEWLWADLQTRFRYRVAVHSLPSLRTIGDLTGWQEVDRVWLLHSDAEVESIYGRDVVASLRENTRIDLAGYTCPGGGHLRIATADQTEPPVEPFVLFVLGGGGEHPGLNETATLAERCNEVADVLSRDHGVSTVLIGGPHFEHSSRLSRSIRFVRYTARLDQFLARADLTILRPGFNTLKRALTLSKRIAVVEMRVFEEAAEEHIAWLKSCGRVSTLGLNNSFVKEVLHLLTSPVSEVRYELNDVGLARVVSDLTTARTADASWRHFGMFLESLQRRPALLVRIDDVARADEPLIWLLACLRRLRVPASLGVVPYHNRLEAEHLERFDPDGEFLEVAQHGHSHLPTAWAPSPCEFSADHPSARDLVHLESGLEQLRGTFGPRWSGGYAAPYDRLPPWLPPVWRDLGGELLSLIWAQPRASSLPVVRTPVEMWSWQQQRPRSIAAILSDVAGGCARRCESGIVIHPQNYPTAAHRAELECLLSGLVGAGMTPVLPSSRARLQASVMQSSWSRSYARARDV